MNKKTLWLLFSALFLFAIDRLSKLWALSLGHEWVVNNYLSYGLVFNRGINWGLLNSSETLPFTLLTIAIGIVIVGLMIMAVGAAKEGKSIIGYVLIITGAFSNFLDRLFYGGVIDFIVIWFGDWSWPAFNIADAAILLGIAFVLKDSFKK